jgi:hypothetical protein
MQRFLFDFFNLVTSLMHKPLIPHLFLFSHLGNYAVGKEGKSCVWRRDVPWEFVGNLR